jgi:hypothetical protein
MSKEAASNAVRAEWRRRSEVEYRSAAYTSTVTHWLLLIGAPPSLVRAGLRIVGDEIAHAELSHRTHRAAGGHEAPHVTQESMTLPRAAAEPLDRDVTRAIVEIFCLGETVAVPLFHRLRRRCTAPTARKALDRVLKDEVRHRDFGWLALEWLLSTPRSEELRALAQADLGGAFARLKRTYVVDESAYAKFDERDRAWGLMPVKEYAEAVEQTWPRVWSPRFSALGIDASAAWRDSNAHAPK